MSTFSPDGRKFIDTARITRLATADSTGHPRVVPICYTLVAKRIVSPLDEKAKTVDPSDLRRVRDIKVNSTVAVVVDRYNEDWSELGWVQIRGTARLVDASSSEHRDFVISLKEKYPQHVDHALTDRPLIEIDPGHVISWGSSER